jgi:signal transduction histidine kinase
MQSVTDNIVVVVLLGIGGTFLMVVSFIFIYIRNQNKMLLQRQQLQHSKIAHQKDLLEAIITSQETERKRIGQDLHDDVGTALSGLRLTIELLQSQPARDNDKYVKLSKDIIDNVIKDVRNISHSLSPPALTYYGLNAAIEEKCTIINQAGNLNIKLVNSAQALLQGITPAVSLALYRVLEELINNTIKHAYASAVNIKFTQTDDGILLIDYNDNGKGVNIDATRKGMGLQNIESRLTVINATYEINTAEGAGFNVNIKCPLNS